MTTLSTNIRGPKSKSRLKVALLTLIRQKRYEEISIADIIGRADVGRSTFYTYFRSKEDLLFCGFDQWLASHGASADSCDRRFHFSLPFLKHMRSQTGVFQASMRGAGGMRVLKKAKQVLTSVIAEELLRLMPGDNRNARRVARSRMLAGAFLDLSDWWRNKAPELTAEEVDGLFQEFALNAVGMACSS